MNRTNKDSSRHKTTSSRTMTEDIEMMVAGASKMGKADYKGPVVTHVQARNASDASVDGGLDADRESIDSETRLKGRDQFVMRKTTIDVRYD